MSKFKSFLSILLTLFKGFLNSRPIILLKRTSLFLVRTTLIILIATAGYSLHHDYLRHSIGIRTVKVLSPSGRSGGSGFFVKAASGKTYIMTNAHVCRLNKKNQLNVITKLSQGSMVRNIVKVFDKHDLCLIETVGNIEGIEVSDDLIDGQLVNILGHPKLQPLTVSNGEYIGQKTIDVIVSMSLSKKKCNMIGGRLMKSELIQDMNVYLDDNVLVRRDEIKDIIKDVLRGFFPQNYCVKTHNASQITVYSRGGSSGSPVVDYFGNVIGVLFAGNTQDQFESYMVPLSSIKDFLKDY